MSACWKKLREENPGWVEGYIKVVAWGKSHIFPTGLEDDKESKEIYCWVNRQKDLFYKDLYADLREEKMTVLSNSENWDWAITGSIKWDVAFNFYIKYSQSETGKFWAITQRRTKKENFLTARKIKLLEQIPRWTWDLEEKEDEDENEDMSSLSFPLPPKRPECSKCKRSGPMFQVMEEVKAGTWLSNLKFICAGCSSKEDSIFLE